MISHVTPKSCSFQASGPVSDNLLQNTILSFSVLFHSEKSADDDIIAVVFSSLHVISIQSCVNCRLTENLGHAAATLIVHRLHVLV